jgi:excisionase family DNA binding protein
MTIKLITVKELSLQIRLSGSKIYSLVSQNKIPHYKLGGKILFTEYQITQWLSEQSNNNVERVD